MKIAVIGATGFVGKHIVNELIYRAYDVIGIARHFPMEIVLNVTYKVLNIENLTSLINLFKDVDAVISAYNAGWENPNIYDDYLKGAQQIQDAVKLAGVKRFIVIGGAGSLWVNKTTQVIDTPEFPKDYYLGANAARNYLEIIKQESDLDWSFFSPAVEMHQGITTGRTGNYRLGKDEPVLDDNDRSILSVEDLAVVVVDELENNKHIRMRFTAAY